MKFSALDKSILAIFCFLFVGLFTANSVAQYRRQAGCDAPGLPACALSAPPGGTSAPSAVEVERTPLAGASPEITASAPPDVPPTELPQAPPGSDISLMPTPFEPTATGVSAPPGVTPGNGLELVSPPLDSAPADSVPVTATVSVTATESSPPGYQSPATATQSASAGPGEIDSPVTISVTPLAQQLSPPLTLNSGSQDDGKYDAFVAASSMAVQFYYKRGSIAPDSVTDYRALVRAARGNLSPDAALENPDFLLDVTTNSLAGYKWYEANDSVAATIKSELQTPNPVVVLLSNWSKLSLGMPGVKAHAVLVYGIGSQYVYYIDPWDGKRYRMTIADFISAVSADGTVHLVTFEVLK